MKLASMNLVSLGFALALAAPFAAAGDDPHFDALIQAERDFAADSPKIGIREAFAKHFGPDAIVFRPGPLEARDYYAKPPTSPPPPITLDWGPSHAEIAASGDLGYTFGPAVYRAKPGATGPDGKPLPAEPWFTDFFSIWVRDESGRFWNVLDQGVADPKTELTDTVVRLGSSKPAAASARVSPATSSARLQQLLRADRLLAAALATDGADAALKDALSPDAYLLRDGGGIIRVADGAPKQEPVPMMDIAAIRLSAAGDLGATAGHGGDAAAPQTYQRAWRWTNGAWKLVVDLTSAKREKK